MYARTASAPATKRSAGEPREAAAPLGRRVHPRREHGEQRQRAVQVVEMVGRAMVARRAAGARSRPARRAGSGRARGDGSGSRAAPGCGSTSTLPTAAAPKVAASTANATAWWTPTMARRSLAAELSTRVSAAFWQKAAPAQLSSPASCACKALHLAAETASSRCSSARTGPSEVVVLTLAVLVLHVDGVRQSQRLVRQGIPAAGRRGVRPGFDSEVRPVVLDERGVAPVRRRLPRRSATRLFPSTLPAPCPPGRVVRRSDRGRRSRRPRHVLARDTFGPATTSGTWMSVSNAVSLPGVSRWSPMWQSVVGAEEDVGVAGDAVAFEPCLDLADQLVDRLHRLRAHAELGVDVADLRRREQRVAAEPGRLVATRSPVEGRRARRLQPREVVRIRAAPACTARAAQRSRSRARTACASSTRGR